MNITLMVICASSSLVLFALFKYGFIYLHDKALLKRENKIIDKVLEKHGEAISARITETMINRVNIVWKERPNDNDKSAIFTEARGTDNEDTETTG